MIVALIPAGGRSSRMGQPKLLLPLGRRTVLEHVIAALQAVDIPKILVVAAPDLAELATLARASGAEALLLPEATPDMRATVEHGLRWIEERWAPTERDSWLLVPADHPTLRPDVVEELVKARAQHRHASIFVPTFGGKRGHPVLLGWRHAEMLRAFRAGEGINVYLREQSEAVVEAAVDSAEIHRDLDTPDDYEQLQREFAGE